MTIATCTFPASFAQRRLWFIQRFAPESAAYNMLTSVPLPEIIDAELLQSALDALVGRHESLRTSFAFAGAQVIQRVASTGRINLQVHTLDQGSALRSVLSKIAAEPFDLSRAPLARVHLAMFPDSSGTLTLVLHHIIADGQSLRILLDDLASAIEALRNGRAVVLPESPVEYADYAVWQHRYLTGRRLEGLTAYWVRRLDGLPELQLPMDRKRPSAGSVRGAVLPFRIDASTAAKLREMAAASRTTIFAVLLSGFAAVLSRFSGQTDFGIGIPVSSRNRIELERVCGLFVNSIVFRTDVSPEMPFAELVRRTADTLAEDLAHHEMPFELVVEALRAKRRADRNPLFQVMLQVQVEAPHSTAIAASVGPDEVQLDEDKLSSQLDLSFIMFDHSNGVIEGGAVFSTELFEHSSIKQMVDAFVALLADALRDNSRPVGMLPINSTEQRGARLAVGEGPRRKWPSPYVLHEWFAECVREAADLVAIESPDGCMTFAELDRRSNCIASTLRRVGVRSGEVVVVCLPRSADCIIALIGVLKAGASYLVVDPTAPPARREFIVHDCRAHAVIVAPGRSDCAFGRQAIDIAGLGLADVNYEEMLEPVSPQSAAYVIYTSGSTGQPKGVAIPHSAIVNHMRWMIDCFDWRVEDRILQRTPLTFDASVWEVWAPLLTGATLVLTTPDGPFDPAQLLTQIERGRITILQVVPSLLRSLLDRPEAKRCRSLRRVFCGGEPLPLELTQRAFRTIGGELINLYGPSETTIDVTYHICAPASTEPDLPIGRPITNVVARVLDHQLQPVPCGVIGELYIGGAAVGLGYIGQDALTKERFVPDPHASGGRLFRTGDLVSMAHDGLLRFRGRADDQVKVRGFRIEPCEVDAHLLQHPAVAEAATVVQQPVTGDQRLVAFVRPRSGTAAVSAHELVAWLRTRLPAYAVPSAIGFRDSLPKTSHGKIDRIALRDEPLGRDAQDRDLSAPRSTIEREVCRLFGDALRIECLGIDDDFFLLGGHSLLVIPVCEAISQTLNVQVNVVDLFEFPTPRLLAQVLEARTTRMHTTTGDRTLAFPG